MSNKKLKKTVKKTSLWQRWFPSGSLDPCWWVSRNVTSNRTWNKWYWRNESRRTFSKLQSHEAQVGPTNEGGGSCNSSSKFSSTVGTDRKLSGAYCNSQNGDAVVTLRRNLLLWNNYKMNYTSWWKHFPSSSSPFSSQNSTDMTVFWNDNRFVLKRLVMECFIDEHISMCGAQFQQCWVSPLQLLSLPASLSTNHEYDVVCIPQ